MQDCNEYTEKNRSAEKAKKRNNKVVIDIIKQMPAGVLLGLGAILPGISGGVLAVAFGMYRRILDAVEGFFRDIKGNTLYLLPVGASAAVGMFLGALMLNSVMKSFYSEVMFLFIGLVIGGIPSYIGEAVKENGFRPVYLVATVIGACIALSLMFFENDSSQAVKTVMRITPIQGIIAGAILAIGTVIPGISTSFVLIYFGWYQGIMSAVSNVNITILIFVAIGFIATALPMVKLVKLLFVRVGGYVYFCILGFMIISIILIIPNISGIKQLLICILFAICGCLISYTTDKIMIADKAKNTEKNTEKEGQK